jgi:DNA adenine methylase
LTVCEKTDGGPTPKEDEDMKKDKACSKPVRKTFPITKEQDDQQIVYGVVSEPDTIDLQGDRLSAEEIRKACHKFMIESQRIGKEHRGPAKADIIESYIAPVIFECNGQVVRKGSWVLAVKVQDQELWQAVKSGDINGFSIAGQGSRIPF